jgi:hypothetical protein
MSGKTEMTAKQAARAFKRAKAAQEKLAPLLAESKRVLTEHFEATGEKEFEGVGFAADTRTQLDTTKVRAYLGDKISEFTKSVTSRTLFVLEGA